MDSDGDDDDDSIGSDFYKDEEDRQKLAKMSELDREMILADRATKKSDRKFLENFRKPNEMMAKSRKVSKPPKISCGIRSSARSADVAAAKDGSTVSNELRAKRQRLQDPETRWKPIDTPIKGRNIASTVTLRSSSSSKSESSSSDDQWSTIPTFEDIKEITIRRSKLSNWFMEPFFEDLIAGCFVRVGIGRSRSGPVYRLCMVKNVDASNPNTKYMLEDKTTNKYLNVFWGNESSAARWWMAMMSDSPPLKQEYDLWVKEVKRSGSHMPSIEEVIEKKNAIQKTKSFVYSAETVKKMVQVKQSAMSRPINVAVEKEKLRRQMEAAKSKNDEVEVETIKKRLQELEEMREVYGDGLLESLNRRNRILNFRSASQNKAEVNKNLKEGEDGCDPCSRRWTRSRNCYSGAKHVQEVNKDAAAASNGGTAAALPVSEGNGGVGEVAATATALEEAADAIKEVDLYALHNFDLPISLSALYEYGGPRGVQMASVERKQRIEATVGGQVLENDGRRRKLTLTIDEYRRRRRLL